MQPSAPVGVVLLQLGTPDAPTPEAVRRYLEQFLRDRRVVDLSPALWLPILYLRVLRTRPFMLFISNLFFSKFPQVQSLFVVRLLVFLSFLQKLLRSF